MGMKPPLYTDSPGPHIRNNATDPKKTPHHNIAKNTATVPHGPGEVPTESYVMNESVPMRSPQLRPIAGKDAGLAKGSPRPTLRDQSSYGPTGANPDEKPLSALKYGEIRTTTRGKKSSPPY